MLNSSVSRCETYNETRNYKRKHILLSPATKYTCMVCETAGTGEYVQCICQSVIY